MFLHSCLNLQPPSGEASASEGFAAAPATGKWDRGTEGGSGLIHRMMGPTQLPSPCRARPPAGLFLGLGSFGRGGLSTHYLQPHSQEGRWKRGRDGGGTGCPA